jgi:Cys-tRNA(Pro)/Cys-tRNA(Cys) deacylase
MGNSKTNAMRILDKNKVSYEIICYDNKDGKIDGISVANKINKSKDEVKKLINCVENHMYTKLFLLHLIKFNNRDN